MKKFIAVYALAILASCASFAHVSPPASADSICFNTVAATPVPAIGRPTLGLCNNNILQVNATITGAPAAPTPIAYPTNTAGVLLVQPTNVPTTGVTVVNTPGVVIQNTSIPVTAATTLPVSGTLTVNTPVPGPTDANGIPLVHPTAIGTVQVTGAFPTPVPYATAAGSVLQVQITVAPTPLPAQVNACNVGFTACSNVGTTVTDGYSDLLESLFSTGFAYIFNGTSWDRQRDVQGVGNNTSGLGLDAVGGYLQYNTVLPTPSAGMYTAIQGDSNGRMIISPTTLPTPVPYATAAGSTLSVNIAAQSLSPIVVTTPVPLATAASLYPKVVVCDPTTAANCRAVSSSGVGTTQVCSAAASCANVAAGGDVQTASNVTAWTYSQLAGYNGSSLDRARTAGVGNTIASTGLMASVPYCENLTALPTLTNATYGAAQCDTSGRLLISPTGLPTPLATQPVSGTVTVAAAATPAAVATTVASSATSVTVLAAATATNGVSFCNNSTAIAYLSMTTPATATTYFAAIPPAGTVPTCIIQSGSPSLYKGAWYAVWASANGTMIVTYW
jgi:hypothetical protein